MLYRNITQSSEERTDKLYLHEAWREINDLVFNKTVIMYDANFTVSTIIRTFKYLKDKTIPNTDPEEKYFPNLIKELKAIRFDYMCLSLIYRRLYKDVPNKLLDLCSATGINFGSAPINHSIAIGKIFLNAVYETGCTNLMEIKHIAGITLGQVISNQHIKPTSAGSEYYFPCLPITDEEIFRKYNF